MGACLRVRVRSIPAHPMEVQIKKRPAAERGRAHWEQIRSGLEEAGNLRPLAPNRQQTCGG